MKEAVEQSAVKFIQNSEHLRNLIAALDKNLKDNLRYKLDFEA